MEWIKYRTGAKKNLKRGWVGKPNVKTPFTNAPTPVPSTVLYDDDAHVMIHMMINVPFPLYPSSPTLFSPLEEELVEADIQGRFNHSTPISHAPILTRLFICSFRAI